MLLAIDVGNTGIGLGIFKEKELVVTWRMSTSISRLPDEYAAILLSLLRSQDLGTDDITDVCLCSVVPPAVNTLEIMFQRYFNLKPLVIGAGTRTGVKIRMDNPREVGPDRIVHGAAAFQLYGGPLIIVDLGTATTFDTISKNGDYIGGAIAPGIQTGAEALFARTAMLPRVNLSRPARAIGTNTVSAMQSGIVFGYISLIEGMVNRIQKELPEKAKVILTGGFLDTIAKESHIFDIVNPDLILIGLRMVYAMNKA
ncbi:MAG: type III pantothenate kinase [Dehalococcoidales bacterium]|nr:type III pantothenate kinase [Dehalococcoidales bacterium]